MSKHTDDYVKLFTLIHQYNKGAKMDLVCMGKFPEHVPVCEIHERRWFAGGEIHEESQEYWYCERCKELLPSTEIEDEIPF